MTAWDAGKLETDTEPDIVGVPVMVAATGIDDWSLAMTTGAELADVADPLGLLGV